MKKFMTILLATLLIFALSGCNMQLVDTQYKFDYVIIELPNGATVEGEVQSWKNLMDGDQIQVTVDGVTYLTHSSRVILIAGEVR